MKFILLPSGGIIFDVIRDILKCPIVADDDIVEASLPAIRQGQSIGVFGHGRFIRADNRRNCVFSLIAKSGLAWGLRNWIRLWD